MLCRLLLKDDKGLLSKESARSVIDGSVFQKLAEEREKRLQRRRVRTTTSCSLLRKAAPARCPTWTLITIDACDCGRQQFLA